MATGRLRSPLPSGHTRVFICSAHPAMGCHRHLAPVDAEDGDFSEEGMRHEIIAEWEVCLGSPLVVRIQS